MPDTFLTTSSIYSLAFGFLFGLAIVPFIRFPRSWAAFAVLAVVNALIPYLTATELLVRLNGPFVVHLALFITAVLFILNLGFVLLYAWRSLRSSISAIGEAT